MKFRLLVAAIAVAVFQAQTQRASADYVLDGFSSPSPGRIYQIAYINGNPYHSPTDAVGAGVTRDIQVQVHSPVPANFNSASGTIGAGTFTMDTDNASAATSTLRYTLTGAAGNLSGATAVDLSFLNMNPGNSATGVALSTPVTVSIDTATGTLTSTMMIDGSAVPFTSSFDFSSFTGTGDLSRVNSITITLNGGTAPQTATDFALDEIRVKTVPAPPAVLLAGIGMLALAGRTRLIRRSAATV